VSLWTRLFGKEPEAGAGEALTWERLDSGEGWEAWRAAVPGGHLVYVERHGAPGGLCFVPDSGRPWAPRRHPRELKT
jgi:hypothetical protein